MHTDLHDSLDPGHDSPRDGQAAERDDNTHEENAIQDDLVLNNDVPPEAMQAVEDMLQELDMDEDIHRVPSAFRILRQPQPALDMSDVGPSGADSPSSSYVPIVSNSHSMDDQPDLSVDSEVGDDSDDDDDDGDAVPFGYIPLDQDDLVSFDSCDDEGEEDQIESAARPEGSEAEDKDDDAGQGFASYLEGRNGEVIVPTIPEGVRIDGADVQDPIPEADVQTIQAIMQSFVLPPSAIPDWAKAIPEEQWLPRIAARQGSSSELDVSK